MSRVAIPIDSIVVVPADGGVWSEEFARVIAAHLATGGDLRVVPAAMARSWAAAGEHSPEEVARRFNARCVVDCRVTIDGNDLDIRSDVIDALAEKVIDSSSYLVSAGEAVSAQLEIVRWIARCCDARLGAAAANVAWCVPAIQAKVLRRAGAHGEALALIREAALRDREALAAFAEHVVDAPSRVLDERSIAIARLAACDADDLVAARLLCRFERDWAAADGSFARAAARNGDPAAHAHYGLFLAAQRRFEEAESELRILPTSCPTRTCRSTRSWSADSPTAAAALQPSSMTTTRTPAPSR